MKCGSLYCKEPLKYELLSKDVWSENKKKTHYYAGVHCPKCDFTHRISPLYLQTARAVEQVKAHNLRVSKIH